jgi:hypothetical protein
MNARSIHGLSLFAALACILVPCASPPALASAPAGLAGKLGTVVAPRGTECGPAFQWYEYFQSHSIARTDALVLDLAIIPFSEGITSLTLDMNDGPTFFGVEFKNGKVNGLHYDPTDWNDVSIAIRVATQDYLITVNGNTAGPFPLAEFCPDYGGCFSVQAISFNSYEAHADTGGWVDSITLTRTPAGGSPETLYAASFDDGAVYTGYPGTIVASPPPGPSSPAGGILDRIDRALSAPGMRRVVRGALVERLHGAMRSMDTAESKSAQALKSLIPALEVARGRTIPAAQADVLLAKARAALAALTGP